MNNLHRLHHEQRQSHMKSLAADVAELLSVIPSPWLIDDIAENGDATNTAEAEERPVPTFSSDNVREGC